MIKTHKVDHFDPKFHQENRTRIEARSHHKNLWWGTRLRKNATVQIRENNENNFPGSFIWCKDFIDY